MCSIFLAVSRHAPLDIERCKQALNASLSRGPDYKQEYIDKNIYLGYNILSITGQPRNNFNENGDYWVGLNGEIYNETIKNGTTDTEIILQKLQDNQDLHHILSNIDGMFGLVCYDKRTKTIYLARDSQGEKTLYVYYDENWFVASSTLVSIEVFFKQLELDTFLLNCYFHTRHFLTYNKTIYKNVIQVSPGSYINYRLPTHNYTKHVFSSLFSLINKDEIRQNSEKSEEELTDELDCLFKKNIAQMIPQQNCCVSFSGGIDSSLIAYYVSLFNNNCKLIATNCKEKDYISNNLTEFQQYFKQSITTIDIDAQRWTSMLKHTYAILRTPLPSHNYCTKVIFADFLQKNDIKVCFGGEGADELFGGYNFYKDLQNTSYNLSPYSSYIENLLKHDWDNSKIKTYLNAIWQKAYVLTGDSLLATSFTDFYLEVVDDGFRNTDQICGWYGIEGRSPFARREIIKFALNLPKKYKRGKTLLINLFKKYFPNIDIKPKQGFAGFPNEAKAFYFKPYKGFHILSLLNIKTFEETKELAWKLLNTELFYECHNSGYIDNTFST